MAIRIEAKQGLQAFVPPEKLLFAVDLPSGFVFDALNAVQAAYNDWMKPAWDALEAATSAKDQPAMQAAAGEIAKRGFAFVAATGAHHFYFAPEDDERLADVIGTMLESMRAQVAEARTRKPS